MSITEDTANQPAAVTWTTAWTAGNAKTTAAFTPQAGTLLVALISGGGNGGSDAIATISDNVSGTWTKLVHQSIGLSGTWGAVSDVWIRYLATSPGSMTVSAVVSALNRGG